MVIPQGGAIKAFIDVTTGGADIMTGGKMFAISAQNDDFDVIIINLGYACHRYI